MHGLVSDDMNPGNDLPQGDTAPNQRLRFLGMDVVILC